MVICLLAEELPPAPGRVISRTGAAQPPASPTESVVARTEERPPEPGRFTRSAARTPFDNRPPVKPHTFATEERPPAPGGVLVGEVGFGVPRRPVRPLVFSPEVQAPAPGSAIVGKPPAPYFTPQQAPTEVVIARAEEPPPFPGFCFARLRPLVPSIRLRTRPVVAFAEEPPPTAGSVIASHAWLGKPPPARFTAAIVRGENAPPFAGWWLAEVALPPSLPLQQLPGRVLVAFAEAPRPEEGRTMLVSGVNAGAVPPDIG